MHGDDNAVAKTVHGATATGITDRESFNRFRSALSEDQKDYVEAFSKETDEDKRKKILDMMIFQI